MARADIDASVATAVADVKAGSINWALFGYAPKSDTKIQLVESGEGGFAELSDNWNDGKVLYAFVKFTVNNLAKYVYIAWCGEGVAGMKKGNFNTHANEFGRHLQGFHVQINARSEDDLNEAQIVTKLGKAGGASYDSGAKNQGSASPVIASVAQGRQAVTQSNASKAVADKSDYNKKAESQQFWNKVNADEQASKPQAAPKLAAAGDYAKTSEREQFWKKQQQDDAAAQAAAANPKPVPSRGNVAARFNPQPSAPVAKPAPAPARVAVSAKFGAAAPAPPAKQQQAAAPPPPPQPQPEPVAEPEPAYEEPAPEEPPAEAAYEPAYDQAAYDQASYDQTSYDQASYDQTSYEQAPAAEQTDYQQQQGEYYDETAQYTEQPAEVDYAAEPTGGVQARALYAYEAQTESDLCFPENATITVIDQSDPSGWWQGTYENSTGYFPSNFVELI
eukprot:TRINITY_DN3231_c0_g1_i3.p3 TRINITY_DN3231_c0_g1~~TRINITY_DN3231_c0_g1_i3.p3  ORF type:complete len:448 (-),score=116.14 TRINITY_DN3231_c0_g1_i3:62-1405(-)